jgi:hypothetical protein
MKQRANAQPVTLTSCPQAQTLPCWHELPAEHRQTVIIALTAMMVKCLPERRRPQEGEDE